MELLGTLILLAVYGLPSIIAIASGKQNAAAIVILNLLLGWTLLGWIAALVWAAMAEPETSTK